VCAPPKSVQNNKAIRQKQQEPAGPARTSTNQQEPAKTEPNNQNTESDPDDTSRRASLTQSRQIHHNPGIGVDAVFKRPPHQTPIEITSRPGHCLLDSTPSVTRAPQVSLSSTYYCCSHQRPSPQPTFKAARMASANENACDATSAGSRSAVPDGDLAQVTFIFQFRNPFHHPDPLLSSPISSPISSLLSPLSSLLSSLLSPLSSPLLTRSPTLPL
jgi:hypothetical protein